MHVCVSIQVCGLLYFVNLIVARSTTLNYPIATTQKPPSADLSPDILNEENSREGRGMMMVDYDHEDHDIPEDHKKEEMTEEKAVKTDPWANYYDFIINEGSFKFWAAFQLATAILLIYSAFAAVYYAKFNVITTDYDYYDDFFGRSNTGGRSLTSPPTSSPWLGLGADTIQRIFSAISSKKFS